METRDYGQDTNLEDLMGHFGFRPPGPRAVFVQLQEAALGHGVLKQKTKELVALAVCICGRREDAIEDHVRAALRAGASRAEVLEVIGEAILMGGQHALPYGQHAANVLEGQRR